MREVVYRNLTSARSGKKDVLLKEVFERDGVTAKTERRSFYFIKEAIHLNSDEELQTWVGSQNNRSEPVKRHFHIMKEHSDALGTDKFVCKILGLFYAVLERDIYTIAFLHSFKINFTRGSLIK